MTRHRSAALTLALLSLLLLARSAVPCAAGELGRSPWIGIGVGGGGFDGGGGAAAHVDAGWGLRRFYVSGRWAGVGSLDCCTSQRDEHTDAAVLGGLQHATRTASFSIGAGPGLARVAFADDTWGLALEARALFQGAHVGWGLYTFANVNGTSSFFGANLALRLGGR